MTSLGTRDALSFKNVRIFFEHLTEVAHLTNHRLLSLDVLSEASSRNDIAAENRNQMTSSNTPNPPDDQLPDHIVDELQQFDAMPFAVPTMLDKTIIRDAHEYLAASPAPPPTRRWFRVAVAVSSVCAALLLFTVTRWTNDTDRSAQPLTAQAWNESADMKRIQLPANPRDIDENGTVDILDAYALARRLESGKSTDTWDFNSDGQLDESDIQLVAFDAVML